MVEFSRVAPDLAASDVVGQRTLAVGIDAVVVGLCSVALATLAGPFDAVELADVGLPPALLFAPVVWMSYAVALVGTWGQTLGKYLAGVVVVDSRGDAPTYRAAAVRELLRLADVLGVGLLSLPRTTQRQRLGDRVADTIVVRAEREERPL
ncbi:RDD family protein [Halomarina litorea]|uniref:RDD family protein n=1 Tax=Halomarina litorea TaxID=2961595 RepID=UPI0020C485C3|nr:RDD family protein [Halomarina sp. BCD28]